MQWTRRAAAALTGFALLGGLHAMGLAVLARWDDRAAVLAGLATVYVLAAAGSARALRRGRLARARFGVGVWAATVLGVVGAVGALFGPGPMFWWTASGAVASWLVVGIWLGRQVAAEQRASLMSDLHRDAAPAAGEALALRAPSPNESLQPSERSGVHT